MRLLFDTHILLWAATDNARLTKPTRALILDQTNRLFFSTLNIWEVAIKSSKKAAGFEIDPRALRQTLLLGGYEEVPVRSEQIFTLQILPLLHRDPFDRLLLAQAITQNMHLVTADKELLQYSGPLIKA